MRRLPAFPLVALLLSALAISCGEQKAPATPQVSRDPVSVRGWITDIEGAQSATFRTAETEAARKTQLFQNTNVWIENAPFVSGGVAENGSFILLDVPPGNVTISFAAPGAPNAKLVLNNIPGNADVFVPSLMLTPNGVELLSPDDVRVRMAARVDKPLPNGKTAIVAGHTYKIVDTPYAQLNDRRDYPDPPASSYRPVATVK